MQIDLLYFEGCPSWKLALVNLRTALAAEKVEAEIRLVRVDDPEEAARVRFLGSPSLRIDGRDLWPEERQSYDLSCRVYATGEGLLGFPTVEMLREKIRKRG